MLDRHLIAVTDWAALPQNIVTAGNVRVTVLADRLFRIEKSDGKFTDEATQSVWFRNFGEVRFACEYAGGALKIKTDAVTLNVNLDRIKDSSVVIDGKEAPIFNSGIMPGTARTLDMNPRGEVYVDDERGERREIPFSDPSVLGKGVISRYGVACLDDGKSLVLKADGMVGVRERETDIYVFAYGHDYYGAVSALYKLTGKTPMLPKYVFGNWWSRYHAYTEKEYLELLDKFRDRNVPIAVATVDMDWHYVDVENEFGLTAKGYSDEKYGSHGGWTGYTWNKKLFPNYKRFLRELKKRNLHVTLNLHPSEGIRWFEDCYDRVAAAVGKDGKLKEVIPFDFTDCDFINAYFSQVHRPYEEDGVDFWWIDWQQGVKSGMDGYDPLWGLNHFHYLHSASDGRRPLILSRYAGVGSHRYPLGFSGDTVMTWELFDFIPYFTAAAANIGYTLWSHDIGAHYGGIKDNELYLRWLEFGVFSPVMRLHSCNSPVASKEPWMFDSATENIACSLLRRRAALMPHVYSLAADNHFYDRPVITPLYYKYPRCDEAYRYPNEYFFGDLLVAPITRRADKSKLASVNVWIPEGEWYDIYTHRRYRGNCETVLVRDSANIPALVKAGDFVITADACEKANVPRRLNVFTSLGSGQFSLYEDDGISADYEKGVFARTVFRSEYADDRLQITLGVEGDSDVLPALREYEFTVSGVSGAHITLDGKKLKAVGREGYTVFATGKIPPGNHKIELTDIVRESRKEYISRNLVKLLSAYNGDDNFLTEEIFDKLNDSEGDFDGVLACYDLPANLVAAIKELQKA